MARNDILLNVGFRIDRNSIDTRALTATIARRLRNISIDRINISRNALNRAFNNVRLNISNVRFSQVALSRLKAQLQRELSNVNVDGVSGQIEAIQAQITEDNAEAEAWVKLDENLEDDDAKIEKLLNESSPTEDSKLLDDFMSK